MGLLFPTNLLLQFEALVYVDTRDLCLISFLWVLIRWVDKGMDGLFGHRMASTCGHLGSSLLPWWMQGDAMSSGQLMKCTPAFRDAGGTSGGGGFEQFVRI